MHRLESSKNPRNNGTMSRNGDQSRSRSGLRNNNKIKANQLGNQKNIYNKNDPINNDIQNKSRSLGRKTNEKQNIINNMPYQNPNTNIRDSSVSNTSNPAGNSSLATYNSVTGKQKAGGQFGMMNNFMPTNLPHSFYNPANGPSSTANGANYSYEINLNAVNKSLN